MSYTRSQREKKNETFRTYGSRVVPHLSTRQAQRCLTSEFGWDLVFPPWYDRMSMDCYNDNLTAMRSDAIITIFTRTKKKKFIIAIRGFDPRTFGLWAQRATAAPNRYVTWYIHYKIFYTRVKIFYPFWRAKFYPF